MDHGRRSRITLKIMKKLICRDDLINVIVEKGYNFFVDERCCMVSINYLIPLLFFKYFHSVDDMWYFEIKKDKLICENISGMVMAFPLKK
jgi:hypothetical protein